ncbi:10483_t:CDS:2 [Entrophospora sp. SA101]|nr:1979_t:CDS:2 [Entrophospora sp. SA101]CAJ0767471.1 10483_t:CDS:2 [Entrophospora sp. SA101]
MKFTIISRFSSTPRSKLLRFVIVVSIFTILWNIVEGAISVVFGLEDKLISLLFFGIDSFIEVASAFLVLWRLLNELRSDKENMTLEKLIDIERKATIGIGILFCMLAIGTFSNSIISLVQRKVPETSLVGLIISCISISFMGFLWIFKYYLGKLLNSSTIASDAKCSLGCIVISLVLFLGSLIYLVWKNLWWIDPSVALILTVLFAKEGIEMIIWAKSKDFNGGCCKNDLIKNNCNNKDGDKNGGCCDNEKGCRITIEISNNIKVDKCCNEKDKKNNEELIIEKNNNQNFKSSNCCEKNFKCNNN